MPNDPRGSWSDAVYSEDLAVHGEVVRATSRRSHAWNPHDVRARLIAKADLKRPHVWFNGEQAREVARGFADYCVKNGVICWAAAVMPGHVHLVLAGAWADDDPADRLKGRASAFLRRAGLHPFCGYEDARGRLPTPWAVGRWRVFLDTEGEVARAVRYVETNPEKDGLRPQGWRFVQRPGWMPQRGTIVGG